MKYLVFVGMIISLNGTISYIVQMLKGKAKPNRVTWLMWSIAPLIATAASLKEGVTLAVVPVFMAGFSPLIVFIISSFKKEAYWKIKKFDYVCGILSLLALILWYVTKNAIIAIVFSIASDLLAGIPTLLKAWNHPETEDVFAFIASILSCLTTFFAIEEWNFVALAFPVYIITINICIVFAIQRKHFFKKEKMDDNI